MASNTQKLPKRNRIEMIGSAAVNTFTNAAAVALFVNPALSVNPANIPAPQARTTSLKLVASNPISYVPKPQPHTPQQNVSEYQILVKKGDMLGEVTLQGTPRISGIDNNGNVLYGATTGNGWFAYFRNREVLWHSYQEIDGFKTGSGDFSNAVITPEGDTYIVLGGTNEQSGKAGYIVLRNGQVAFDSTKEVPGVIDIISFDNNRGLTFHKSTGQIAFRYSYQEPGQPWQSGEKILGTSPLFNKYTGKYHLKAPTNVYEHLESQNGKYGAFTSNHAVYIMGGKAVSHPVAQLECCPTQGKANEKVAAAQCEPGTSPEQCKPKIYDIWIGGAADQSYNHNVLNAEENFRNAYLKQKDSSDTIVSKYFTNNQNNEIRNYIENEISKDAVIRVVGHSYGGDTAADVVGRLTKRKVETLILVDPVANIPTASHPTGQRDRDRPKEATWEEKVTKRLIAARQNVTGQMIDIDPELHTIGTDTSDSIATGLGKFGKQRWAKLPASVAGIICVEALDFHHAEFNGMVGEPGYANSNTPKVNGRTVFEILADTSVVKGRGR